jgi:hypothetical protein
MSILEAFKRKVAQDHIFHGVQSRIAFLALGQAKGTVFSTEETAIARVTPLPVVRGVHQGEMGGYVFTAGAI